MEGFQISKWFKTLPKPDLNDSTSDEAKSRDPDNYTKLEGTMNVTTTEGEDGGRAIWTLQFEKVSEDIKDTRFIVDYTTRFFQAMDEMIFSNPQNYLKQSNKVEAHACIYIDHTLYDNL